jgi:F-type H+-transporting ATPase subunit epsilon
MATMHVEIVSAEKSVLSVDAQAVYARSLDGEIGILPGHQPALLALDIAPIKVVLADGSEERVAVHHGFLYVRGGDVVVLADIAELSSQIDVRRAEARKRAIEERLVKEEGATLEASLRKQELRMRVGA